MSLSELLDLHPFAADDPLLVGPHETLTLSQVRARVATLAGVLSGLGVTSGDAVGVQLPNGPDAVVAMFAVWSIGAVFVPINSRATDTEVADIVASIGPVAMMHESGPVQLTSPCRSYDGAVAFVLWTSGTTGTPKPILHTHRDYLALIDRVLGPLRESGGRSGKPPTPNLIPVSLSLNAGLYNVLFGLRAGASVVIMDRFTTGEFAELVHRHQIRSTVLPPAAIAMLADDPTITDLTPLRYVRSITAPLSPLQARRFAERFGAFVLNSYGQAEIGEVIGWTGADAKEFPQKLGALGRPHPGVSIRIADDGELLVQVSEKAAGYAGGDDLADRLTDDGYLHTGDIARIDDDGFVWIEGRISDLINRGGNKVFPDQVEEVLRLSPAVADAAVVGQRDERLGEVPIAYIVNADDIDPATDTDLDALCREHLVAYKVPVEFRRIALLPRNEIGKLLRRNLA